MPAADAYWRGWPEVRADLRSSAAVVLVLALAGLPAGLLWWWLAPRADFRITDDGPAVIGTPSAELLVADDMVLVLVLAGAGLLPVRRPGSLRRRRGVATVLALALGCSLTAVVAWQLGELLGAGPTEAQLAEVGGLVTTSLTLGSLRGARRRALHGAPGLRRRRPHAPGDDLGRTAAAAPAGRQPPSSGRRPPVPARRAAAGRRPARGRPAQDLDGPVS